MINQEQVKINNKTEELFNLTIKDKINSNLLVKEIIDSNSLNNITENKNLILFNNQKKKVSINNYSYSIAILKIILSYLVIACHFWLPLNIKIKTRNFSFFINKIRKCAVPIFMIISFFLTSKHFNKNSKIWKRIIRIIYPLEVWAIFHFIIFKITSYLFKFERNLKFIDLLWLMLLGRNSIIPQFWYLINLLLLSIFFWILGKFTEKYLNRLSGILLVFSLIMQYSELNYKLFRNFRAEIHGSVGRIFEMIPYASLGILTSNLGLIKILEKNKIFFIILLIYLIFFFYNFSIFVEPNGLRYQGVEKISFSYCLFLLMNLIPFNSLNQKIKDIIRFLSKYSFGVYCLHMFIGKYLNFIIIKFKMKIRIRTLKLCILIKIICVFISKIIDLIPSKFANSLVC